MQRGLARLGWGVQDVPLCLSWHSSCVCAEQFLDELFPGLPDRSGSAARSWEVGLGLVGSSWLTRINPSPLCFRECEGTHKPLSSALLCL